MSTSNGFTEIGLSEELIDLALQAVEQEVIPEQEESESGEVYSYDIEALSSIRDALRLAKNPEVIEEGFGSYVGNDLAGWTSTLISLLRQADFEVEDLAAQSPRAKTAATGSPQTKKTSKTEVKNGRPAVPVEHDIDEEGEPDFELESAEGELAEDGGTRKKLIFAGAGLGSLALVGLGFIGYMATSQMQAQPAVEQGRSIVPVAVAPAPAVTPSSPTCGGH